MHKYAGALWRKSRRSTNGGDCVEVAVVPDAVGLRDSTDPHGPVLDLTREQWHRFARSVKAGEHDV
ncbi:MULTISPECIES: DUF397 domain-containing protein [Streptosporangium]|uniref:DUF397 domain-containing protein n=1 Tax=Streptosporangium brasiliense TaxID=47480 RepID=A0ABT9RM48_9ACTN|nr:DUF397 domain-containing protein [Streptosporangium brasiliense]MDP9870371.1 hypothetical protein [Streptosporangium brasiliense]